MKARGEPRLASLASWLVLVASFGLSAATWIALAGLAGFDRHLVWLMPAAVDGYIVVALVLWMSPVPPRVARFAKINTYCAAAVGVAAQSAFHCLSVLADTGIVWRGALAAVVGALPPAVAALAVHMRALVRRESARLVPELLPPAAVEAPQVKPAAAAELVPVPLPEPAAESDTDEDRPTRARKGSATSAPRRPFALTQQAAASMEAGGMSIAQIAQSLGISERQVRAALKPVPVDREQ